MDKSAIAKMLAGTITRGVMWAAAWVAAKTGVACIAQDTGEAVGLFLASVIAAAAAMAWSWYKNRKLLNTMPPGSTEPVTPHDGATL